MSENERRSWESESDLPWDTPEDQPWDDSAEEPWAAVDDPWRGEMHLADWPEEMAGPEYWLYKGLAEEE